jgi:hypothetical protein
MPSPTATRLPEQEGLGCFPPGVPNIGGPAPVQTLGVKLGGWRAFLKGDGAQALPSHRKTELHPKKAQGSSKIKTFVPPKPPFPSPTPAPPTPARFSQSKRKKTQV